MRQKMNPKFNLFLDDLRDPGYLRKEYRMSAPYGGITIPDSSEFLVARNTRDAKLLINILGYPSVVALDHDLGENEPSGYDFVKWLIEKDLDENWMQKRFLYVVHSLNPVGNKNMFDYLDGYFREKFGRGDNVAFS